MQANGPSEQYLVIFGPRLVQQCDLRQAAQLRRFFAQ